MPKTLKSACSATRLRLQTTKNMATARAAGHDHVKKAALDSLGLYQRQIAAMQADMDDISVALKTVEYHLQRVSSAGSDELHQMATAVQGVLRDDQVDRLRIMVDIFRTGGADATMQGIEQTLRSIHDSLLNQRQSLLRKINQINASYQEIKMRLR